MKMGWSGVKNRIRVFAVSVFIAVTICGFFIDRRPSFARGFSVEPTPTPRRTAPRTPVRRKYSEFPHDIKQHNLECSSCHKFPSDNWNKVRTGESAFPDATEYPKHESCLSCHRAQFFTGAQPAICSLCHTHPGPRNSVRHPFPNPREIFDASPKGRTAVSDFAISFPHDKHIEIVTGEDKREKAVTPAEESCSVCHATLQPQGNSNDEYVSKPPGGWGDAYWLKRGTFKTTPISHATCFTCHSADTGITPEPNNCAVCHKLKPPATRSDFDAKLAATMKLSDKVTMDAWRRRDSSATFRHEWFSHSELACATCHNVTAINTVDALTKKVSITSCGTCHATAAADDGGALNFEMESRKTNPKFQCVKCHLTYGKLPVPDSHVKALAAATGK
jgi:hypothetical protein